MVKVFYVRVLGACIVIGSLSNVLFAQEISDDFFDLLSGSEPVEKKLTDTKPVLRVGSFTT